MRVAIVGGGVTGLSLAYELAKRSVEVEIFERGPNLGGLASGFDVLPGVKLEHFYHHIFQTDVDFISLAAELGVGDRIHWYPASIAWFLGDAVHRFDSPLDVLTLSALSVWERAGLARTMLELRQRSRAGPFTRRTAEEWFAARAATGVYRKLWEPMLEAKWGADRDAVSAAWLWQKVRARGRSRRGFRERLGYPSGGFGVLTSALHRRIDDLGGKVRVGTTVRRIVPERAGTQVVETDDERSAFDAVVSTLPPPNLAELVPDLPHSIRERLTAVRYRGVVCHVLVMRRPLSDTYWLNIADRSIPLGGVVEHTNLVPPEHYGGRHIAYLFNYLPAGSRELELPEDAFVEHHFPHLHRIFPAFDERDLEERFVFRTAYATPIYRHPYQPPPIEPMPGLWLADTSRIYPMDRGTSECIRLARYVSARILGSEATAPGPV